MKEYTKTDLARETGVTQGRITQLITLGLPVLPDGGIDRDAAFSWIVSNTSDNNKIHRAVRALLPAEPEPEVPLDDQIAGNFLESLLSGTYRDKAEAERIKENALAGLRTLELRRKAGELVEFDTAKTVLFEQARAYRDALMQWPTQAGPLLAADLDLPAEQVTERLNAYIREFLSGLGEPDPDSVFPESE